MEDKGGRTKVEEKGGGKWGGERKKGRGRKRGEGGKREEGACVCCVQLYLKCADL